MDYMDISVVCRYKEEGKVVVADGFQTSDDARCPVVCDTAERSTRDQIKDTYGVVRINRDQSLTRRELQVSDTHRQVHRWSLYKHLESLGSVKLHGLGCSTYGQDSLQPAEKPVLGRYLVRRNAQLHVKRTWMNEEHWDATEVLSAPVVTPT